MKLTQLQQYSDLVERIRSAVSKHRDASLCLHEITTAGKTYELMRVVLGGGAPRRVLLSAGMHGNELAGVQALSEWLETRAYAKFLQTWDITILPCINPWGYEFGTRENGERQDLNREFNSSHPPQEVLFVQSVMEQRFNLSLELHADEDSTGYYLYETAQPGVVIGHHVLERINTSMPVNLDATIDGKSAERGVIVRPLEPGTHTSCPMAVYGFARGIPCSLTLEAGRSTLRVQVQSHLLAIEAALSLCP
ncbi:MAG TPA: M14 family metallocarboxypeptidase [Nitrospira sp.]|nr:M14 family metallocarboxypeptidase [Nitrospira sp.]